MSGDYDFEEGVGLLVKGLELPEGCLESSLRVCELVKGERSNFRREFYRLGGLDALAAVSVYVGGRQRGCPVPAGDIISFVRGSPFFDVADCFDEGEVRRLGRRYRNDLSGLDPVFVGVRDYIGFFVDDFSFPVSQSVLCGGMGVSTRSMRSVYKEVVEGLTGVCADYRELDSLEVTKESFGFHGEGVEDFALFLVDRVEDEGLDVVGRSPQVLAAAVLYIAGKLI